jgi:hypothetical protein
MIASSSKANFKQLILPLIDDKSFHIKEKTTEKLHDKFSYILNQVE